MAGCGRCCLAGLGCLAVFLAVLLYPMSQWPADVNVKTRFSAVIMDQILPKPETNLCTLVAYWHGTNTAAASRMVMDAIGSLVDISYVDTEDLTVGGVPVRLYRPKGVDRSEVLPLLIYMHGGGFVTGTLAVYDAYCAKFSSEGNMAVVSVDYRLGPEHLFPAAFNDSLAVAKAILSDGEVAAYLAINPAQVSVGGDSAGGCLAVSVALYLGRTDLPTLRSQVAIYPSVVSIFAARQDVADYEAPGGLSLGSMSLYRGMYLGGLNGSQTLIPQLKPGSPELLPEEIWRNVSLRLEGESDVELILPPAEQYPYAETVLSDALGPMLARDLSKLPPTIVVLAGLDPLYEDGRLCERRLHKAGVEVRVVDYPHQIHGFASAVPSNLTVLGQQVVYGNREALDGVRQAVKFVKEHL